jgi:hypothetical protein
MRHFRSILLIVCGLAIGMPIGWILRGRSVAAKEALLHNLIVIDEAKQQISSDTNNISSQKP